MVNFQIRDLFYCDMFSMIMISLVSFIGLIVCQFSRKYMKGDVYYSRFLLHIILLCFSVMTIAISDHLILFLGSWGLSNAILVSLMIHKRQWKAATASGVLAGKFFLLGLVFIAIAFILLYMATGEVSISAILCSQHDSVYIMPALIFLLLGAMTQSAIWPFHIWLISSLNSPTPVSAIMHAGLVNGGGVLIIRFARLYCHSLDMLNVLFIVGLVTALMGALWKLMQSDVKRMLACSTMSQMGFMFMQCGLGLFSAAVAHFCWHGMFKAYMFLSSGSAAQVKKFDPGYSPSIITLTQAFICGVVASFSFVCMSANSCMALDSHLFIMVIVVLAGTQCALPIVSRASFKMFFIALVFTSAMGGLYGVSIYFFELILAPLDLMKPQSLNIFHWIGSFLLIITWASMLFARKLSTMNCFVAWHSKLYVTALNASQPHPDTITTHRNYYK